MAKVRWLFENSPCSKDSPNRVTAYLAQCRSSMFILKCLQHVCIYILWCSPSGPPSNSERSLEVPCKHVNPQKGAISKGKDRLPTTIFQGTFVSFRGSNTPSGHPPRWEHTSAFLQSWRSTIASPHHVGNGSLEWTRSPLSLLLEGGYIQYQHINISCIPQIESTHPENSQMEHAWTL